MNASLSIAFDPLISGIWISILAALMLVLAGIGLLRRQRAGLYRAGFIALMALALANPQLVETQREDQRGVAIMVLDDSASQNVTGRLSQVAKARTFLEAAVPPSAPLDWRVVSLSDTQTSTGGTPLVSALTQSLRDVPAGRRAGVVLVTDGQIDDLERLQSLDIEAPVHAVMTGSRSFQDRRLQVAQEPAFAEVGTAQSLSLKVEDIGFNGSEPARLRWQLNEGKVQSRLVTPGQDVTISFTPTHRGQNVLDIQVEERAGEVTTLNNRATFAINGVRNRLRVVLVSGEPYQGERLWRSTLKSDPSVDLVHFTILRLPTSRDVTPVSELSLIPFPTQELFEKNLTKFDLVIFDRYSMRGVLQTRYLANLAAYVRQGGALLVAVGPEYGDKLSLYTTPLGDVLPVSPKGQIIDTPFRPNVTALGQKHPVTAGLLQSNGAADAQSWGPWFRLSGGTAMSGQTVMTGPLDLPLLVLDRQGDGRVAMIMSDQSWVWGRGISGGGPYNQFVRRLVHWLMREPDLEEEHLAARADGDRLIIERRSIDSQAASVSIQGPDGTQQTVKLTQSTPGLWRASIPTPQQGLYRVSDDTGIALVAIGADNRREITALQPSDAALSAAINGGIHWLEDGPIALRFVGPEARQAGRGWLGLHDKRDGAIQSITQRSILPGWAWLILLSGSLLFAWWRESR